MQLIDKWIKASGSDQEVKAEYNKLLHRIPKTSSDPKKAVIAIKESLFSGGFKYDHECFTAHDVIRSKGGNCLGVPLLIGSIMSDYGFTPQYKVITVPYDITHNQELEFFNRIKEEISYDNPILASAPEDFAPYRFHPLEHLVLDVNGFLLETTSEEHSFPGCESIRDANFEEALSYLYGIRSAKYLENENLDKAVKMGNNAISQCNQNRQIYRLLSDISFQEFDDFAYHKMNKKYKELDGDDSLFHFSMFETSKEEKHLEEALKKYSSYGEALVAKATLLEKKDPDEARYLYSLASHCLANSHVLDLGEFYSEKAENLSNLFGSDRIIKILNIFEKEQIGKFDWHLSQFKLSGNSDHLGEACEAAITPLQKLKYLTVSKDIEDDAMDELKEMDERFKNSKLYVEKKKSLMSNN